MNETTGKAISGADHLRQSLARLFTTPIGSRLMNRDYGSLLFAFIDQPANEATLLQLYASLVDAITRWEPRLTPTRVFVNGSATSLQQGHFELHLEAVANEKVGEIAPGELLSLDIPLAA